MMRFGLYVDGDWSEASDGATTDAIDPSNGEVVAQVASATPADVDRAVAAAARAAREWRLVPAAERGRRLRALADLLVRDIDELARLETLDAGGGLDMSEWTVRDIAARRFEYFAGLTDKLEGRQIPVGDDHHVYTSYEPLGVTAHIVPWNGPLWEASRSLAPALAAGNAVVLKPAQEALLGVMRLGELAKEAGLPDGLVNVLPGGGTTVGRRLVEHPGVRGVTFTGSVAAGQDVMRRAAADMTRLVLELGGNAANIVFPDADLEAAVEGSATAAFANAGQICVSGPRLFVHASIRAEFTERLLARVALMRIGPGMASPDMGPVVSQVHMERVLEHVRSGVAEGARLLTGGSRIERDGLERGYFVAPTVFDEVHNGMGIARHEIFGPVVTIIEFETADEVVELANDTPYGLASGLWTNDLGLAHRVARDLHVGQVYVNEWFCGGIACPAGGYKLSGIGREEGRQALRNYLELKSVRMRVGGGARAAATA